MLKVMQKYRQYILVVGGVLLMVAFLAPEAIKNLRGDPRKQAAGTLGGTKVSFEQLETYSKEFQLLKSFQMSLGVEDPEHWMMLCAEAERAGLVGGESDADLVIQSMGDREIQRLAQGENAPKTAEEFTKLAEKVRAEMPATVLAAGRQNLLNDSETRMALAKVQGAVRLIGAYRSAPRFSDRRAILLANELYDTVVTDFVAFPADRMVSKIADPTPEQLQAHFDMYKGVKPGEGEAGVGYTRPPRVKIEVLTLDRAAIRGAIKLDPVDVRKAYLADRAKYPGEFEAEKAGVESNMLNAKTDAVMNDAVKVIQGFLRRAAQKLPQDGTWRKIPADWTPPSFSEAGRYAVESVLSSQKIEMATPTVTRKEAKWLTAQELFAVADIGPATIRFGQSDAPLAAVALQLKELGGRADLAIQKGMPYYDFPFVNAQTGNRHFLLVLDYREESPADSVDEVREQAVKDFKSLASFGALKARAEEMAAQARAEGLDALAKANPLDLPAGTTGTAPEAVVRRLANVTKERVEAFDPIVEGSQAFRDAVLEAARSLDPATRPVSPLPKEAPKERTGTVVIPQTMGVAVFQTIARRPLTAEDFRAAARMVTGRAGADEVAKAQGPTEYFSRETMATRLRWEPVRRETPGSKDAKKPEGATPEPAKG